MCGDVIVMCAGIRGDHDRPDAGGEVSLRLTVGLVEMG